MTSSRSSWCDSRPAEACQHFSGARLLQLQRILSPIIYVVNKRSAPHGIWEALNPSALFDDPECTSWGTRALLLDVGYNCHMRSAVLQRESNAEVLLALLEGRQVGAVGTRPHSLPANLAHLWQSLKVTALSTQSFSFSSSLTLLLYCFR